MFTAPFSSSSHNGWGIGPQGHKAESGAAWSEGGGQADDWWGQTLEASPGVSGQDRRTELAANAWGRSGCAAAGETQPDGGWANGGDAGNSASCLDTWDMQPSANSDASWSAGVDAGGDTQDEWGWNTVTDAVTAANSTSVFDLWDTRPSASSEAARRIALAADGTQHDFGWGAFSDAWTTANSASGLNTGDTQPSGSWEGPGWEEPEESQDHQQASEPWYQ